MFGFGKNVRMHLFGRSHGECVGCILDGIPKGLEISADAIDDDMRMRMPSRGIGTERIENDAVDVRYGIEDGRTNGLPILMVIPNTDVRSSDYSTDIPRPGHADLPSYAKWGIMPGGGPFSGRLTAPIVAAGSIARQLISKNGVEVNAYSLSIGDVIDAKEHPTVEMTRSREFPTRACGKPLDEKMSEEIMNAKNRGDSVGGVVRCHIDHLDTGFGGIWFDALDSKLSEAMFSIPGVKAVGFGKGFGISAMKGSESNDPFFVADGRIMCRSNNMGGILGGMASGMPVEFDVAFKPTPSISMPQMSVDMGTMENVMTEVKGRHDPCIVPRAVSVVEAMACLVVADRMVMP